MADPAVTCAHAWMRLRDEARARARLRAYPRNMWALLSSDHPSFVGTLGLCRDAALRLYDAPARRWPGAR